eukprot:g5870.t1
MGLFVGPCNCIRGDVELMRCLAITRLLFEIMDDDGNNLITIGTWKEEFPKVISGASTGRGAVANRNRIQLFIFYVRRGVFGYVPPQLLALTRNTEMDNEYHGRLIGADEARHIGAGAMLGKLKSTKGRRSLLQRGAEMSLGGGGESPINNGGENNTGPGNNPGSGRSRSTFMLSRGATYIDPGNGFFSTEKRSRSGSSSSSFSFGGGSKAAAFRSFIMGEQDSGADLCALARKKALADAQKRKEKAEQKKLAKERGGFVRASNSFNKVASAVSSLSYWNSLPTNGKNGGAVERETPSTAKEGAGGSSEVDASPKGSSKNEGESPQGVQSPALEEDVKSPFANNPGNLLKVDHGPSGGAPSGSSGASGGGNKVAPEADGGVVEAEELQQEGPAAPLESLDAEVDPRYDALHSQSTKGFFNPKPAQRHSGTTDFGRAQRIDG